MKATLGRPAEAAGGERMVPLATPIRKRQKHYSNRGAARNIDPSVAIASGFGVSLLSRQIRLTNGVAPAGALRGIATVRLSSGLLLVDCPGFPEQPSRPGRVAPAWQAATRPGRLRSRHQWRPRIRAHPILAAIAPRTTDGARLLSRLCTPPIPAPSRECNDMARKKANSFRERDVNGPPTDDAWIWHSAALRFSPAWRGRSVALIRLLDLLEESGCAVGAERTAR